MNFIKMYLPIGAEIVITEDNKPLIIRADLNGDYLDELIVAYRWQGNLYVMVLENHYGIFKCQGRYFSEYELMRVRNCILSHLKTRSLDLYPAPLNMIGGTKWGYINESGKFIIKPSYDSASNFQGNGLAVVGVGSLYGIIDHNNNYIVSPKYNFIGEFSNNRAVVMDDKGFNIINEMGKILTNKTYSYIGNFKEGRAQFNIEASNNDFFYGFLDKEGKEVIPAKYQYANDFRDGKAVVKIKENEYALINIDGIILSKYNYAFVGSLGDGLLAFKENEDGKYGYIDINGKVIIKPQFYYADDFSFGRAIVNNSEDIKNNYGLIDKLGFYIIKPQYNSIISIGESRVAVGIPIDGNSPYIGSKYAIYDTDGNVLTKFIYYGVSNYKGGVASVYDDKETFFIDKEGKRAKDSPVVSGSGTLTLQNNLIMAFVDYITSYFDKQGILLWKENLVIHLNQQYKVIKEKYKPNKDYLVYYPRIEGMEDRILQSQVNDKLKVLSKVKKVEENVQLDYSYVGNFQVQFFKKELLVLELNGYNYPFGAAHGMPTKIYTHINLVTGAFYELKDLFKKDINYVKILSDIIGYQIKNDPKYSYVFQDSYTGIKEDQPFYVSEDGLYIYFYPYDIGPYSAGFPTFKILYKDIINIIDLKGDFWRSFN